MIADLVPFTDDATRCLRMLLDSATYHEESRTHVIIHEHVESMLSICRWPVIKRQRNRFGIRAPMPIGRTEQLRTHSITRVVNACARRARQCRRARDYP